MAKYSNDLLKIYEALLDGETFGKYITWDYYNNKPMPYPYFHYVLWKHDYKNLFLWCHFGSSANKATLRDLKFIIEEIFRTTPAEFLREYTIK